MCWGTPAILVRVLDDITAEVDFGDGVPRRAVLGLDPSRVSSGDAVIVHAGVVVSKLSYEEIEDVIRYLEELASLTGDEPPRDIIEKLRRVLEAARRAGE
ncbi:MAG: HypC/HybG/HupF family hydrogenase formation chaperone [Acidilobaceae archaeon]